MSISRQNLSVVIVTFMSDEVIHDCIQSISSEIKIIVIDNSNNRIFKESIEKKYKNVECYLSPRNIGMGAGNNLGLKKVKTDYAFILNPDVVLEENTIDEIIYASKDIESFGIIAPISNKENYPNYKLDQETNFLYSEINPFKVNVIDGFALLLNLKKLNQIDDFKNFNYFDENFFMYLENDDLCKKIIDNKENIYVIPKSKINHLGGKAVNNKYEYQVELSRNWHWIWSKFYFNKKHFGFFVAFYKGLPTFLSASLKFLFYYFVNDRKKNIYLHRALGFISALFGKNSYFRPKINN